MVLNFSVYLLFLMHYQDGFLASND
uniref:Uncharacterized protein n=1 Tax=Arundo donax TaxID=35708 RepID=A0A0A9ATC4_ARUDO